MKKTSTTNFEGLTDDEVIKSREEHGINMINEKPKESLLKKLINVFKEPMFILLIIAASVYFILGEYGDGMLMLIFVLGISFTEFIQESKTENALEELKKLSSLNVQVLRNNKKVIISSEKIVVGDIVYLKEGDSIPADGIILHAEGLGVNESSLTGESITIYKSIKNAGTGQLKLNKCYSGTSVTSGTGIIKITEVGVNTKIGMIGNSLNSINEEKSLLEKQINKLIFICTIISLLVCIFTIIINFINYSNLGFKERIIESSLAGITIAMATIPEEVPVVLTVFLAMGAYKLTKEKALVKSLKKVETLGSISVLCADKTGTLTEDKMSVKNVYKENNDFYETAVLSCHESSFDAMDIAIKDYFKDKINLNDYKLTKDYPFSSEAKMMGKLWNGKTLCVKGAYENVLSLCDLSKNKYLEIESKINEYTKNGYRVIVFARKEKLKIIPKSLENVNLTFTGFVVFNNPPKKGVKSSIKECTEAGIRVIMITGDNGNTAKSISKELNINNYENILTGKEINKLTEKELCEKVKTINIYARVYPEHKMRIISALQKNGEVVAMTGDGVNDAPALKKADIGIAMGRRGTNVAKEASDLVLLDDNFTTIVKAIKNGRSIYNNIRKALNYLIVIHIPPALLALFVPIFKLPILLLPVHILLLELLIDPTSSIVFQRLKPSIDIMKKKPRNILEPVLTKDVVKSSIFQGIYIFLVTFINYYVLISIGMDTNLSITLTYSMLVISTILAAYNLKSNYITIKSILSKDLITSLVNISIIIGLMLLMYVPFLSKISNMIPLNPKEWIYVLVMSSLTIIPFDIKKLTEQTLLKEIN